MTEVPPSKHNYSIHKAQFYHGTVTKGSVMENNVISCLQYV